MHALVGECHRLEDGLDSRSRPHGGARCFSFFAIAGDLLHRPRIFKTKLHSDAMANWSFWFMMIGGLGFFVTLWLGGFWQGWQWNNPSIPFIDTIVALEPIWTVRFFSGILIFAGITLFLYNIMATVIGRGTAERLPLERGRGR